MREGALRFTLAMLMIAGLVTGAVEGQPMELDLPTSNDALFENDGSAFYQYTDRTFNGRRSQPWQAGQYGFVRNPKQTSEGIVYTRFHEGVDIKAQYRNGRDEPLDTVQVIADGEVVYVNGSSSRSNYGKYIVVEHWWSGAPYYSLYAHLNAVNVQRGQWVQQGDPLGRLGYTGRGINRRRAHVHFELNLLMNRDFQGWYREHFNPNDPNHHGIYNGMNLAGVDVAGYYLAAKRNPSLTIKDFIASQQAFFSVVVPHEGMPDLLYRYSWLSPTQNGWTMLYRDAAPQPSWKISFTRSGLPIRIEPSSQVVTEPIVEVHTISAIAYSNLTNGLVLGRNHDYRLSERGLRHLDLLLRLPEQPASFGLR